MRFNNLLSQIDNPRLIILILLLQAKHFFGNVFVEFPVFLLPLFVEQPHVEGILDLLTQVLQFVAGEQLLLLLS